MPTTVCPAGIFLRQTSHSHRDVGIKSLFFKYKGAGKSQTVDLPQKDSDKVGDVAFVTDDIESMEIAVECYTRASL